MWIAIAALALLMLLASGFHICQSRPDKFAIHGTSSKDYEKRIAKALRFALSRVQSETVSRKLRPSEERCADPYD
jgi:hypothetical protein